MIASFSWLQSALNFFPEQAYNCIRHKRTLRLLIWSHKVNTESKKCAVHNTEPVQPFHSVTRQPSPSDRPGGHMWCAALTAVGRNCAPSAPRRAMLNLLSLWTYAVVAGEWSAPRTVRFNPTESAPVAISLEVGRTKVLAESFSEEINVLPAVCLPSCISLPRLLWIFGLLQ